MIKKKIGIVLYLDRQKISPMLSKSGDAANISTNISKTWRQFNLGNMSGPIEAICASEVVQWKDVLQEIGHCKWAFPSSHQRRRGNWGHDQWVQAGDGLGLGNLEVFSNLNGSMTLWDVVALQNSFVWKEDESEDTGENLKLLKKYHLTDYQKTLLKAFPIQKWSGHFPGTMKKYSQLFWAEVFPREQVHF